MRQKWIEEIAVVDADDVVDVAGTGKQGSRMVMSKNY